MKEEKKWSVREKEVMARARLVQSGTAIPKNTWDWRDPSNRMAITR